MILLRKVLYLHRQAGDIPRKQKTTIMRQTTFTQESKYAVINLINEEVEYFETIEEAIEFQKEEIEYWNLYEHQNPYTEDDICIETVDEE